MEEIEAIHDYLNSLPVTGEVLSLATLGKITLTRGPGDQYEYSNLAQGLLGHLLCTREGKDFQALLIDRILDTAPALDGIDVGGAIFRPRLPFQALFADETARLEFFFGDQNLDGGGFDLLFRGRGQHGGALGGDPHLREPGCQAGGAEGDEEEQEVSEGHIRFSSC